MKTFETERLHLRPFTEADLARVAEFYADEDMTRFMGRGKVKTLDETREYMREYIFNHYEKHGYGLYAVLRKETGELIGRCGLLVWNLEGEELELTYMIDKKHWGQGYAPEAMKFFRDWALKNTNFPYLISMIRPQNLPSIRVAEKLGMSFWKERLFLDQISKVYRLERKVGS